MITDEDLHRRANLYAQAIVDDLGAEHWQTEATHSAVEQTVKRAIAIAFVIGFAAGVEATTEDLRRTVKRPR